MLVFTQTYTDHETWQYDTGRKHGHMVKPTWKIGSETKMIWTCLIGKLSVIYRKWAETCKTTSVWVTRPFCTEKVAHTCKDQFSIMYYFLASTVTFWNLEITMRKSPHQAKTAGTHKHIDHTDLCLVANKQVIFHGVWYVTDDKLQGATLRNPGKPSARPGGGATGLMLPALHPTALRIYRYLYIYVLHLVQICR